MSIVAGRMATPEFRTSKPPRKSVRTRTLARFERAVDPDNLLSPTERAWRAQQLRAMSLFFRANRRHGRGMA
ncbi:hypothetical protein VMT65_31140 [Nocardia sp. CDC153]|uniref:hypothetical protein n=1 Tax=Nocardia sp. CDC153 TaxID=3112167 RepID=UPI002DB63161|nr:hypothetical protein [Nocardia sp. CDC153]MEC3957525.1 hypothetical protein [Nocardia sp. CDC153]